MDDKGAARLAASSYPNLPAIEGKIQNADDHPCNREDGCRDIRIDQLIQVVEQKPTLVRLNASLAFEKVLQQRQRTRPRKQFRKDSPDKRNNMQPAKNRS